jgi:hypothetical protein
MRLGAVCPASGSRFLLGSLFSIFLLLAISASTSIIHAQSVDFSMRTVFRGEGLPQGSSDNYNEVIVTSLYGFSGQVSLSATVVPILSEGPTVSFYVPSVSVPSGGSGATALLVSTVSNTPLGNYTVTITGTSGTLSHTTSFWLYVSAPYRPPDFVVTAHPSLVTAPLSPHLVVNVNSNIGLTSLNGFSGTVSLSIITLPGPAVFITPSSVMLDSGGTANATLTIQPFLAGNYTVTVIGAASGNPSHFATVSFNIQPPATDVAVLAYRLAYNANPVPGGTLVLTNSFTNAGAALISVTGLTFNLGFGSYVPSTGLPLNLTSGENKVLTVKIMIPLTATLGNQSLLATLEWIYYAPSQGLWLQGPTRYESGGISVSQSPISVPLGQISRLTEQVTILGPWLLVGYAIAATSGAMLVIRQDKKKQKSLRSRQSLHSNQ